MDSDRLAKLASESEPESSDGREYVSKFCGTQRHAYDESPEAIYLLTLPGNVQADVTLAPNPDEVDATRYVTREELRAMLEDDGLFYMQVAGLPLVYNKELIEAYVVVEALEAKLGLGARHAADDREALQALPGVGRKTANVVLNCWFGQETFAVDTHIFRVGNRTGLAKGKTPEAVEAKLEKRVPGPFRLHAHHWLILHGRYVCKARTPECWHCEVVDLCSFRKKVLEPPKARAAKGGAKSTRESER